MNNLQAQFVGLQFFIKNLNSEKESPFLKFSGSKFHIKDRKYLSFGQSILYLFLPLKIDIANEFAYCYFARLKLMLLLMLHHERLL